MKIKMIKKLKTFLVAVAMMFMLVPEAQAYTFTNLDVPEAMYTFANGINDSGEVVGYYYDSNWLMHGFIYYRGTKEYTTLDIPGSGTWAYGINDSGNVVGQYSDSGLRGFIYYVDKTYDTLKYPGVNNTTILLGINDSGDIVGYYYDSGDHGFIYHGTTYTLLDDVDVEGVYGTYPNGINDSGVVVGYYYYGWYKMKSFIYDGSKEKDKYTMLDVLGDSEASAHGINDSGYVVGSFWEDSSGGHGFIYDSSADNYFTLDVPGATKTEAYGINDSGDIVGRYTDSSGIHSFIATAEEGDPTWPSGALDVTIDIKPGSDTNSINLSSAGVIPVAILSSDTFDATTVDPDTIALAGASVKVVGKSDKYLCSEEDVNEDGLTDLVCKIYTEEVTIEIGETIAVLEAVTYDGTQIRGEDIIRIVPDE